MKNPTLRSFKKIALATSPFTDLNYKNGNVLPKGFKTWWTHVWSGLVRDPSGKHHKAIGAAIWLYLYFLVCANWKTGKFFRKTDTIVAETGFSRRSIQRWLKILREAKYIETRTNGRVLDVLITKWRPISRKTHPRTYTKV